MSNRGKPRIATAPNNRCEALAIMTDWKRRNKIEERCPFMATWTVGKNQFCMHHARCQAVAIACERGDMRRIATVRAAGQRVRIANTKESK